MIKSLPNYNLRALKLLVLTVCFVLSGLVHADSGDRSLIEKQAKVVKCYPNPAISFVNFEFPTNVISSNSSILIYSFSGKKMYESIVNSGKITVTLNNDYYRGVYVYQLRDKAGKIIETGKFQVAK